MLAGDGFCHHFERIRFKAVERGKISIGIGPYYTQIIPLAINNVFQKVNCDSMIPKYVIGHFREQKRARSIVERSFGQVKRRFAVLHGELRSHPDKACKAIVAGFALHNMAKAMNMPELPASGRVLKIQYLIYILEICQHLPVIVGRYMHDQRNIRR